MNLGGFYKWFWYHTELWIAEKMKRRPYTFIFRDWIYRHWKLFTVIAGLWYGILLLCARTVPVTSLILGVLTSLLLAHLIWGARWIPEQQEDPPYHPDGDHS